MKRITLFKSGAMLCCILNLFFISIFSLHDVNAQHTESCGFDGVYKNKLTEDLGLKNSYDEFEKQLQEAIKKNKANPSFRDQYCKIPVVVHVMHLGENDETNISYAQVVSAIDALNEDFRKTPGTNGDGDGVDTQIDFCLAERRPDGSSFPNPNENGVNRYDITDICGSCPNGIIPGSPLEQEIKAASYFPSYDYLNIWVINKITGVSSNGEVIGYTYFPTKTPDENQGIVIKYNAFGTTGTLHPNLNLNRTLTHEAGHFLGLFHTFEGDQEGTACPSLDPALGDKLADTDPHIRSESNSCYTTSNECPEPDQPYQDIVRNYMDYSGQTCQDEFTADQRVRMQTTLTEFRGGLINSLGCETGDCPVEVNFETMTLEIFTGDMIHFDNLTQGINTYEWFVDGQLVNSPIDDLNHIFTESGIINVCLQAADANGCKNQYCIEMTVFKDGLCGLGALPYCENLLNGDMTQFEIPPNDDGIIEDPYHLEESNELDVICNWKNSESSPFFCHENDQFHFGMIDFGTSSEAIMTTNEVDLTLNQTYYLSFDYLIGFDANVSETPNEPDAIIVGASNSQIGFESYIMASIPVEGFDWDQASNLVCAYDQDFNRVSNIPISMTSDEFRHIRFYLKSIPVTNSLNYFYIKNISIKDCLSCEPKPKVDISTIDGCTYSFSGTNTGDPGSSFWTIEGGPTIYNESNISYTFSLPGTYEVCYSITCNELPAVTVCEEIIVDASCENCDPNIISIDATKCDASGSEYMSNFSFQVEKGFKPCIDNEINFDFPAGNVFTNSVEIDESNIDFDIISVSILFNDESGDIANGIAGVGKMILCGPNGQSKCYQFEISSTSECDECEDVQWFGFALCDDSNEFDNIFEYSGNWFLTLPIGTVPCGYTSTQAGYSTTFDIQPDGKIDMDFEFSTTDPDPDPFDVTTCFEFNGEKVCYTFNISPNQCPPPIECDLTYEYLAPIECNEVIDGNAYFDFAFSLPPFVDYTFCSSRPTFSSEYGNFQVNLATPNSIEFSFIVPCYEVDEDAEFTFKVMYCKANGDIFCRKFTFTPACEDCVCDVVENITQVDAMKCDATTDDYQANFSFQVEKGFGPCTEGTIDFEYIGGAVITSSVEIDESNIDFDIIHVSAIFHDQNGDIKNGTAGVGKMVLCGPDGSLKCYQFEITTTSACDNCISIPWSEKAFCDDSNEYDGIYEYSGKWEIPLPIGSAPCGFTSLQAGVSTTYSVDNAGIHTVNYNFATSNPDLVSFVGTLCFELNGFKTCVNITTDIEPCPPPTECDLSYDFIDPVECDRVEDGNAYFDFAFVLPPMADYYFCPSNISPTSEEGNFQVGLATPTSIKYTFILPCYKVAELTEVKFKVVYCKANGEKFCKEYTFMPTCAGCDDQKREGGAKRVVNDIASYSIYPNPASNTLNISSEYNNYEGLRKIQIIDNLGKVVFSNSYQDINQQIDISNFNDGLYILRIIKEDKLEHVQKIVILR